MAEAEIIKLPSVQSFFQPPDTAGSIAAIASEVTSTQEAKTPAEAICVGYDPSKWFFKDGKNPIDYQPGVKVAHPFTDDLKKLLSEGDVKKLREVSIRKLLNRKFLVRSSLVIIITALFKALYLSILRLDIIMKWVPYHLYNEFLVRSSLVI